MRTAEFSRKTKMAAWERAGGKCENISKGRSPLLGDGDGYWDDRCNKKLHPGDIFFDHRIPEAISHDNSLGNCQVLCRAHHDAKTAKADVPTIARVKRIQARHVGADKPKRPFSDPRFKRKMRGDVVWRETGEPVRRP